MKKLNKTITAYAKQFKLNKELLKGSLRSSLISLMKILLLHKLQKTRFFKPISLVLTIITKWSLYTTLITLGYSLVASVAGFKYDLSFIIGIFSALWVLTSELSLDILFDYWDKVIGYYNRIIAKIVVKLQKKPETVDYAEKAKSLFAKYKNKMPTDPKLKLSNEDDMLEYLVTREIEDERRRDPNYKPKSKGWISTLTGWYPLSFKDTLYYLTYLAGAISVVSASYYFLDQIRVFFEGLQSVTNTLREINNFRRNIPGYLVSWVWNRVWPFGSDGNINVPPAPAPAPANNNNSWFSWIPNLLGSSSNNQPHPEAENRNSSIINWLKNIWPFGGGNDNHQPPSDGEPNAGTAQSNGIGFLGYFLRLIRNRTNSGGVQQVGNIDNLGQEHEDESEQVLRERKSILKLMVKVFKNKSGIEITDDKHLLQLIKDDPRINDLIYSDALLEGFYTTCIKLLYTADINRISEINRLILIKYSTLINEADNETDASSSSNDSESSGHTITQPERPQPIDTLDQNDPAFGVPGGWDVDEFAYLIIFVNKLHPAGVILSNSINYLKKLSILVLNNIKQIKNKTVKQITKIENKINSLLVTPAPNSPKEGNYYLSKVYHVSNYNNYDLPFKVIIKFFDSLALDEAWINYPNETIKNIAKDRCILLNIKLQSCDFYYKNEDIFNPFIPHDYNYVNNNPIFSINKNIPLDLTMNKFIFEFTFLNSAIINNIVQNIDISVFGNDIDIIFEYKFISEKDYQSKMNEIK